MTTQTHTRTIVKTIPGQRMDVRVIGHGTKFSDGSFWRYQVQYEYSKSKNIWLNSLRRNGDGFDYDHKAALARAKRVHARNN